MRLPRAPPWQGQEPPEEAVPAGAQALLLVAAVMRPALSAGSMAPESPEVQAPMKVPLREAALRLSQPGQPGRRTPQPAHQISPQAVPRPMPQAGQTTVQATDRAPPARRAAAALAAKVRAPPFSAQGASEPRVQSLVALPEVVPAQLPRGTRPRERRWFRAAIWQRPLLLRTAEPLPLPARPASSARALRLPFGPAWIRAPAHRRRQTAVREAFPGGAPPSPRVPDRGRGLPVASAHGARRHPRARGLRPARPAANWRIRDRPPRAASRHDEFLPRQHLAG